jgi:hypothetical protein
MDKYVLVCFTILFLSAIEVALAYLFRDFDYVNIIDKAFWITLYVPFIVIHTVWLVVCKRCDRSFRPTWKAVQDNEKKLEEVEAAAKADGGKKGETLREKKLR